MPSLVPDFPYFPYLDPPAPQSLGIPLPKNRRAKLTERRDLSHETTDLSEEEEEIEELLRSIKDRGQDFYIPLGKTATAQEERADDNLDSASSSEGSMTPNVGNSDADEAVGGEDDDEDDEDDDDPEDDEDEDMEEEEEEDMDGGMDDLDDDSGRYNDSEDAIQGEFSVDPRILGT